jgi:hypothetical protein
MTTDIETGLARIIKAGTLSEAKTIAQDLLDEISLDTFEDPDAKEDLDLDFLDDDNEDDMFGDVLDEFQ